MRVIPFIAMFPILREAWIHLVGLRPRPNDISRVPKEALCINTRLLLASAGV